jgi:putative endonuclease
VHPTTFSARYNLNVLVYFENHEEKENAYLREKQMKKWNRDWKVELIEKENPNWEDLISKVS